MLRALAFLPLLAVAAGCSGDPAEVKQGLWDWVWTADGGYPGENAVFRVSEETVTVSFCDGLPEKFSWVRVERELNVESEPFPMADAVVKSASSVESTEQGDVGWVACFVDGATTCPSERVEGPCDRDP